MVFFISGVSVNVFFLVIQYDDYGLWYSPDESAVRRHVISVTPGACELSLPPHPAIPKLSTYEFVSHDLPRDATHSECWPLTSFITHGHSRP
jgi:hypothetical protein